MVLVTPKGHEDRIGSFQPMSLAADDVFATADAMKKKGVVFTKEPTTEEWGSVAVFKDADGNQFALSSRGKQK